MAGHACGISWTRTDRQILQGFPKESPECETGNCEEDEKDRHISKCRHEMFGLLMVLESEMIPHTHKKKNA
jgi:hypothetical protein